MKTREELEKAVDDASDAYYATDDLLMDAMDDAEAEYNTAMAALKAYDKENT